MELKEDCNMLNKIKNKYYEYRLNKFFLNPEKANYEIDDMLYKMATNKNFANFAKKYTYPKSFEKGYTLLHFIIMNDLINKNNLPQITKIFSHEDFKKKNIKENSSDFFSSYYTLAIVAPDYFTEIVNIFKLDVRPFLLDKESFIQNEDDDLSALSRLIENNYNKKDFMNLIYNNIKDTDSLNWRRILPYILFNANSEAFNNFKEKNFFKHSNLLQLLDDTLTLGGPLYEIIKEDKVNEVKKGFLNLQNYFNPDLYKEGYHFEENNLKKSNVLLLNELNLIPFLSESNYLRIIKNIFESDYLNNHLFEDNIKRNILIIQILKEKMHKERTPDIKEYFIKIGFDLYFANNHNAELKIKWMQEYFDFDLNDTDNEGNNFLHKGMMKYSQLFEQEHLEILIKDNVNLYQKNNEGRRFYDYATENKKNEIVTVLKSREVKIEKEKLSTLIPKIVSDKMKRKRL